MLGAIARIVPRGLKRRAGAYVEERQRVQRATMLKAIPKVDLGPEHIAHLEPLVSRIALLARLPRNAFAAEIGVSRGKFTRAIRDTNPPARLHLIDIWNSERYTTELQRGVEAAFAEEIAAGSVAINKGMSTSMARTFADGYFDWIYIDTDHSYETTRDELALFAPKMKPGGIIAGHDYVMGNWRDGIKYGVVEAVHEFCVKNGWELLHVTMEQTTNASFAIRKLG